MSEPRTPLPSQFTTDLCPGCHAAKDSAIDSDHGKAADQVWAEIEATYLKINDLIDSLPAEERIHLLHRFNMLAAEEVKKWFATAIKGLRPEDLADFLMKMFVPAGGGVYEEAFYGIKNIVKETETKVKDHFIPKARMVARDDEVVRLKDEEGLKWIDIFKRIRANPVWAINKKTGRPVTKRALMVAYKRRKDKIKEAHS
jgi:hypothetical protein